MSDREALRATRKPQRAPRCNYDLQCELVAGHDGEHWSSAEGWSDGDENRSVPEFAEADRSFPGYREMREALETIANDPIIGNWYRSIARAALDKARQEK